MYKKILVPLDGSKFAESALPLALTLSRKTGAVVHLVTVLEPIPSFAYDEWESAAKEWSEEYLKNVLERVSPSAGGAVTTSLKTGHVVDMLEQEAEAESADLVVMATHGRGILSRMWLGSVADAFLHHSDRPVVLVRPPEENQPETDHPQDFQTILVPLDGSELSESALSHASEFGELFDAAYHLTRVVSYPIDIASPYLPHTVQMNHQIVEETKEGCADYLEERAERMRRRGLQVTTSVLVDAQAGHGILQETEAVGCDLIAMATHGREGLGRAILGSVTDKVVRGSHVPLLIYRPPISE
jgi:nucleotide-binding universal stress UspA family protein